MSKEVLIGSKDAVRDLGVVNSTITHLINGESELTVGAIWPLCFISNQLILMPP